MAINPPFRIYFDRHCRHYVHLDSQVVQFAGPQRLLADASWRRASRPVSPNPSLPPAPDTRPSLTSIPARPSLNPDVISEFAGGRAHKREGIQARVFDSDLIGGTEDDGVTSAAEKDAVEQTVGNHGRTREAVVCDWDSGRCHCGYTTHS